MEQPSGASSLCERKRTVRPAIGQFVCLACSRLPPPITDKYTLFQQQQIVITRTTRFNKLLLHFGRSFRDYAHSTSHACPRRQIEQHVDCSEYRSEESKRCGWELLSHFINKNHEESLKASSSLNWLSPLCDGGGDERVYACKQITADNDLFIEFVLIGSEKLSSGNFISWWKLRHFKKKIDLISTRTANCCIRK